MNYKETNRECPGCGATADDRKKNRPDDHQGLAKDAEARGWQPIDTAPKDGTAVMVYPGTWSGRSAAIAKWESNKYAKTPRPYWSRDDDLGRVTFSRGHPPTHWMPLPPPPMQNQAQP